MLRTLGGDEFAGSGQPYGGFACNDALTVLRTQHTPIVYPTVLKVGHFGSAYSSPRKVPGQILA